jgi:hypothetical protein
MTRLREDRDRDAFKILVRRRILEEAREHYDAADYDSTIRAMLTFLENVQATDERVIELHRECVAMIEHAGKVLELEHMTRPIVVKVEGAVPPITDGQ